MTPSNSTIATIHTLKSRAGLDDDSYRDLLQQQAGKRSARDLTPAQAGSVIDRLRQLTGDAGHATGAVSGLDTPLGGKLRALWIAGYDLGIVRDRTDRAMLGFVERQTGVSHLRFLREPREGTAAVEGLKGWLRRSGKVDWPNDSDDIYGAKRAVLNAQWLKLVEIKAVAPNHKSFPLLDLEAYAFRVRGANGWGYFEQNHLDDVQRALGRKLRAALARMPAPDAINQEADHAV